VQKSNICVQNILHGLKCKLEYVTSLYDCFIDDQSPGWNVPNLRSDATSAGRRHESGWGTRAPAAPPDPVVYWAGVKTVGWPGSWSDEVRCFTGLQLHGFTCPVGRNVVLSANVTPGPVTALINVTEIFCRRYLKSNNFTVNEHFLTKFCVSIKDIFRIQCMWFCYDAIRWDLSAFLSNIVYTIDNIG